MLSPVDYLVIAASFAASVAIAYFSTPFSIWVARKIGAIDVPSDGRRMHDHPIPRLGGLSIIISFLIVSYIAGRYHALLLRQIIPGALIIGLLGMVDDAKRLPPWPKLLVQCIAAGIAVASGVRVTGISLFGTLNLGVFSVPITVLWIVGITNAVNLIDGLDGLAAGVATIASFSMFLVALIRGQLSMAIMTAIIVGACLGLFPYNRNPARVFMGDTGATFLGFVLSIISVQGLYKYYAAASFVLPLLILGVPIFDTLTAIVRRLAEGKSPFTADRNHLHHKLIDMGLSQRQAVLVLYLVSTVLSLVALLFAVFGVNTGLHFLILGLALILLIYFGIIFFAKRCRIKKAAAAQAAAQEEPKAALQDAAPGAREEAAQTIRQAATGSAQTPPPAVPADDTGREEERKDENGK
jgi:UDP-GlcNAc:undecaprenyl-phosphate GlcNAc-1-phosphate transferase